MSIYRAVMDPNVNPLMTLPAAQRFQTMLFLSVMWTTLFCASAGVWLLYGEILIAHAMLALGFSVTGALFHQARTVATYRDYPERDGTARYDDVWGA